MNLEILGVALLTALATSFIGIFLVLRKLSMLTDAISHTILLGIVIMYLWVGDLNSPWLLLGATLSGIFTVYFIEKLQHARLIKEDAAIGMVMTLMFSIAIVLISTRLRNVDLHVDTVLLGQLEFVIFERWVFFGISLPASMIIMSAVLILNLLFMRVFFKEYLVLSFDKTLATILGLAPYVLHYLFMTLVSLTAVAAFNAVGAILVIAFMVGPAMSARLLTDRIKPLIWLTLGFSVVNTLAGYTLATFLDLNIAASVATMILMSFFSVFIFAPDKGLLVRIFKQKQLTDTLHLLTLMTHIQNHANTPEADQELDPERLHTHFNWSAQEMAQLLSMAIQKNYIKSEHQRVTMTTKGFHFYHQMGRQE